MATESVKQWYDYCPIFELKMIAERLGFEVPSRVKRADIVAFAKTILPEQLTVIELQSCLLKKGVFDCYSMNKAELLGKLQEPIPREDNHPKISPRRCQRIVQEIPQAPVQIPQAPVQILQAPIQIPQVPVQIPQVPVQIPQSQNISPRRSPVQIPQAPIQILQAPVQIPREESPSHIRRSLSKKVRGEVWITFENPEKTTGKCYCCGDPIQLLPLTYECGHIVSVKDGGSDHLCNLRPICQGCNRSMGSKNMVDYMIEYGYSITNKDCFDSLSFIQWTSVEEYRQLIAVSKVQTILERMKSGISLTKDQLNGIDNLRNMFQ